MYDNVEQFMLLQERCEIFVLDVPCPVCGEKKAFKLGHLSFALPQTISVSGELEVGSCSFCGFVRSSSDSAPDEYEKLYFFGSYSQAYKQALLGELELSYWDETAVLLKEFFSTDSVLVDIGTGMSPLPHICRLHGFQHLVCLDYSEDCVSFLRQQYEIDARQGSFKQLGILVRKIENVVLIHVVEHLTDARGDLKYLFNALQDGGRVYVEVPDTSRFDHSGVGSPLRFLYYTHLLHFDYFHLSALFTSAGFSVLEHGYRMRFEKGGKIPSVWGVFEKKEQLVKASVVDFSLARKMYNWLQSPLLDVNGIFQEIAQNQQPVYVWGVGMHAYQVLGMSPLKDCNIVAVVDVDKALHGIKIAKWTIESSNLLYNAKNTDCVVIAALSHAEKMQDLLRKQYGFEGHILLLGED